MALDFMRVGTRLTKAGVLEIYPKFIVKKSEDLMIKGSDFYAIWNEQQGLWSKSEHDAIQLIDAELDIFAKEKKDSLGPDVRVMHLWDAETGMIDKWNLYCHKQMPDSFRTLDERVIFANYPVNKKDYSSHRLPYPIEAGKTEAYDHLINVLYSPEERHKIEWAIGAVVTGDSKHIQKFLVLYGAAGTGKSTVLNLIQNMFDGYYSVFDAKSLGSTTNVFALEAFRDNPLIAIQHDGDLSRIEDNTKINSLASHELMMVNEKYKTTYATHFNSFMFMGTNKPVRITDAKSGILRRLIDVSPTGDKLPAKDYDRTMMKIAFELGAIAYHCQEVYLDDPNKYDDYIPVRMLGASNDFYDFMLDSWGIFKKDDGVSLTAAYAMYKQYCEDACVRTPFSRRIFKEELKNYFREYHERFGFEDGTRVRSYYSGFRTEKFGEEKPEKPKEEPIGDSWLIFKKQPSVFDEKYADCPAQYASDAGSPERKWINVKTRLRDLDTSRMHYVKGPENLIFVDFDLVDEDGNKCFEKNLEEASKWPATYAELSKSGGGIHLYYIYTGDTSKLSRIYKEHIEIKVATGNSSIRRMVTKCNDIPVASISSGLPIKEERKMITAETIQSEKGLRNLILRNLNKEIHPGTKPSIDFIYKILEDAYTSGLKYDVSDMRPSIIRFASNSSHHADYCLKLVNKMMFSSEEPSENTESENDIPIVFYDVEVFPNLFVICWKKDGSKVVDKMINPSPMEIEPLLDFRLAGYNNRRYDNHMLWAAYMGYSNEQLYRLSQRIISGDRNCFFKEAFNLSYTDVYDFSSVKQSLKKFEIDLDIHHQELGLPWDKPVDESLWEKVAEYCCNDVVATEAVYHARQSDFVARTILSVLADSTVNDTTNSLTTKIIFGNNNKPQNEFNYRFMGVDIHPMDDGETVEYTIFDEKGRPLFPGYSFENGVSTYRGEEVGEGGYVYAEQKIFGDVALLDVASMHPSSIEAENLFGDYTFNFSAIKQMRVYIKHEEFDKAKELLANLLGKLYVQEKSNDILGKLSPYFNADNAKGLSNALKIAINSVYGLTAASFSNPFRDPRNVDNIVAKRGALFMVNLKHEVQKRGYKVAHIKTDSIKIPDATPDIISFVMAYGKKYGYTFEHEATYDKMCLVNDAVYIAKYATFDKCERLYGYSPGDNQKHGGEWTATGAQFAVPYVFKTLFSKEQIEFKDRCETKSCSTALYLDMNEDLPQLTPAEDKELTKLDKAWHSPRGGEAVEEIASKLGYSYEEVGIVYSELCKKNDASHNYIFIGKVGLFCPMVAGSGGGVLLREKDGKYYAVAGTKGYRWLEAEAVKLLGKEADIDEKYYISLVDDAVAEISKYGDFEQFVSDEPYKKGPNMDFMNIPEDVTDDEIPFN